MNTDKNILIPGTHAPAIRVHPCPSVVQTLLLLFVLFAPFVGKTQTVVAPLPWRVETTRPQAIDHTLLRGETISLQPRFESQTVPMDLPEGALVRLLYRSNNLPAGSFHEIPGTLHPTQDGRVLVTWTPDADSGQAVYDYNLIVQSADQTQTLARAFGKLHLRGTVFGAASDPAIIPGVLPIWGNITGTLSDQTDLQTELDTKTMATGGSIWTHFFGISSQTKLRGDTSTPVDSTETDAEIQTWTITNGITDYQLFLNYVRGNPEDVVTYSSSIPAVATVDADGFVTHVTNGSTTITASVGNFARSIDLTLSTGNTLEVVNIVSGILNATHLREKITRPVDLAIAADDGAFEHELFTTKNWSTHTYVRNTEAYAYAITGGVAPWTALAVWRTGKTSEALGQSIRGTLISPDLIAFAWHNAPAIGTQFRYLDTDGVVHLRTLISRARLGTTDSGVGRLDTPLPATVHPAKLLPDSWSNHLSTEGTRGLQLPAIQTNRNLRTGIADLWMGGFSAAASEIPARTPYDLPPVNGDSGSPVFWHVNGDLILLMTWYTPWGGTGFPPFQVTTLATALGAQPPTVADFSGLTTFAGPPAQ